VQKAYADMGVLDFAGFDLERLMSADEDAAEALDRERRQAREEAARVEEVAEVIAEGERAGG